MKIYADHAATTKLDQAAFKAMTPYLLEEYGNASQLYSFARAPKKALKEARQTIADCIGALPEEIFFTSGGTESDNWAIKGTTMLSGEKGGIITSAIEHHAVLNSCHTCEKMCVPVAYLTVAPDGTVKPDTLEHVLDSSTKLVSVMLANNEIGTIQPIRKLAKIAHAHGSLFHTDAVQALGHIPVNVQELDVDLLSASAHKFNGPKGIGFLYIRQGTKIAPYSDGGAQEGKLRAGTENIAAIVGMATALKISCGAMANRTKHLRRLEQHLLGQLDLYKLDYRKNGSPEHIPGNISLSFKNADGEALLHLLDLMGICVSTGSACNATSTELSHVLKAISLPVEYAYGTIRISFGYENTLEEVETIAESLKKILTMQYSEKNRLSIL